MVAVDVLGRVDELADGTGGSVDRHWDGDRSISGIPRENLRSADACFADRWLVHVLVHSDVLYRAPGTQEADAQTELPQCAYCVLQARIRGSRSRASQALRRDIQRWTCRSWGRQRDTADCAQGADQGYSNGCAHRIGVLAGRSCLRGRYDFSSLGVEQNSSGNAQAGAEGLQQLVGL